MARKALKKKALSPGPPVTHQPRQGAKRSEEKNIKEEAAFCDVSIMKMNCDLLF